MKRLGSSNLSNSLTIDSSENMEAVLGYSDARKIVKGLPGIFKDLTAESRTLRREVNEFFDREEREAAAARKEADAESAESMQRVLDLIEGSDRPEGLVSLGEMTPSVARLKAETMDINDFANTIERETYLMTLSFAIKESSKSRRRLLVKRAGVRLLQLGLIVVGGFGVGVLLVNALAETTQNWWISTLISTIGAIVSGFLINAFSNRLLGGVKTKLVRKLAGAYVAARILFLVNWATFQVFRFRMEWVDPLSSGDDLGTPHIGRA